jgi:hypothetical protein
MLMNFITAWAVLSVLAVIAACCLFHNGLSES